MAELVLTLTASAIVKLIFGGFVDPIKRKFGYLYNCHTNFEDLRMQSERLKGVRGRLDQAVDACTQNADEIEPDVELWLEKANRITARVDEEIIVDEGRANTRCFYKLCPNLKLRYQLSKEAENTAEQLEILITEGREKLKRNMSTAVKGYEFESRMSTLDQIMKALRDPNINMIGVSGMGGLGKTTLMEEVARKAEEDGLFDVVVKVSVSQSPNIRNIQGAIADHLGLRFEAVETDSERVDRLTGRLKQKKSVLVILDDLWAKLDLDAVGIPSGNNHKGCKIVLTSRRKDVLLSEMDTQQNFKIQLLPKREAWNLFKKIAGDSVEAADLRPTARKVAKQCAGLPVALVAVGNALKGKALPVWKKALRKLRSAKIEEMDPQVNKSLKWIYDTLGSEEAQKLFLLCCLLPEDYEFSTLDLLKYGRGLGLFQKLDTLEDARNNVDELVGQLKASCLLLDGNGTGFFRLHDVVRDVGVHVASKEKNMLIARNITEWTIGEKCELCPAISLPSVDIHELPTCLKCPKLKFFLFFNNNASSEIPDTLFEGMKQLKVLAVRKINFSPIPSSLCFLSNLQTLCLEQCVSSDIAIIGELKKLEVLSFRKSDIKELPREIGQLTCLKLLDLSYCDQLEVIPSNVFASLSQLEELYMGDSFVKWEVDGNASLVELKYLSRLKTLEIEIPDVKILPKDLVFKNLMRYRIFIGAAFWFEDYGTSTSTMILRLNTSNLLEFGIKELLTRTGYLSFDEWNGINSVVYELDGQGFPGLKYLRVESSSEIEYVINKREGVQDTPSAFPNLESLSLRELNNLKEICYGQPPADSFHNLRKVEVHRCDGLKSLFSLSVARRLLQLQEIKIERCKMMEAIVTEGTEGAEGIAEAVDIILLPQLRSVTLDNLPKLMSFFSKVKTESYSYYTPTTDAGSQDMPTALFNEKATFPELEGAFPNLEELVIQSISSKEIWDSQLSVDYCCKLKDLDVCQCENLVSIVPSNMLMRLQNMMSLQVTWSSESLKYIFDLGELNETQRHAVRATQLSRLYLDRLPGLMHIWKQDSLGFFPFQNLKSLTVGRCKRLRNIFTTTMAKSLEQLQQLSITDCEMLKEIVVVEEATDKKEIVEEEVVEEEATDKIVFPQLTSLTLRELLQLKSICLGIQISEWPDLKQLSIIDCEKVEIFARELSSSKEMGGKGHLGTPTELPLFLVNKVAFPNLEEMELMYMEGMKKIWQGQFHVESFCNLRVLEVVECNKISNVFPVSLLPNLRSLEELSVEYCPSLEELFEVEGVDGEAKHVATLPQLRKLRLIELPNLMHLWKKDSQLTSFCSGSNTFSFPSLEEVWVEKCPRLKTFSHNILCTPKLEKVRVNRNKWLWEGDLNATIQHLFVLNGKKQREDVEDSGDDNKDSRGDGIKDFEKKDTEDFDKDDENSNKDCVGLRSTFYAEASY